MSTSNIKFGARYSSTVLVGNWNEEIYMAEDKIKQFQIQRDNGELFIQKSQKLFLTFLKDVQLEAPRPNLRFGATIQLMAPEAPRIKGMKDHPLVLSLTTDANSILNDQSVSDNCDLSVAPSVKPCVRNAFIIKSADAKDRTDEVLKYNQEFRLECIANIDPAENQSLIVYSSPKTVNLCNVRKSHHKFYKNGEVNQSVGVCYQPSLPNCTIEIPYIHCNWKCLNRVPNLRYETEGDPVPSNTPLVIAHCATNKLLAVEDIPLPNFFGTEYGTSVTTYLTVHKIETYKNIWLLKTSENTE